MGDLWVLEWSSYKIMLIYYVTNTSWSSPFLRLRSKSRACSTPRRGWRICLLPERPLVLLEQFPPQHLLLEGCQASDPLLLETSRNWRWPRGWRSRSTLRRIWGLRLRCVKNIWNMLLQVWLFIVRHEMPEERQRKFYFITHKSKNGYIKKKMNTI